MSGEFLAYWAFPLVALGFGALSFLIGWLGGWDFDRRYGRSPE